MSDSELVVVSADSLATPTIITRAGPTTRKKFFEFFTIPIRNANTRAAYYRTPLANSSATPEDSDTSPSPITPTPVRVASPVMSTPSLISSPPVPSASTSPESLPTPTSTPILYSSIDEFFQKATRAEADGDWPLAAEQYRQAKAIKPDDVPLARKLARAEQLRQFELPNGLDILFYSACDNDNAAEHIYLLWKGLFPQLFPRNRECFTSQWIGKWHMVPSRIYYLPDSAAQAANSIAKWLPGYQEVISFYVQDKSPLRFPDKPGPHYSQISNIDSDRALVIFIGSNYEALEEFLTTVVENRLPRDEEKEKILRSVKNQSSVWKELLENFDQ